VVCSEQHVDRRRFAGPVRAEERHHLTWCDVQVDATDGLDLPEVLVQAGQPDGSPVGEGPGTGNVHHATIVSRPRSA